MHGCPPAPTENASAVTEVQGKAKDAANKIVKWEGLVETSFWTTGSGAARLTRLFARSTTDVRIMLEYFVTARPFL